MLDLLELEQLVAFADCGRLSKAAEKLHISQPTITRTMQHLEEEFGVPLFERSRNRIALNETGLRAVELAGALLKDADQAVKDIRAFDKSLHTITVSSCAPAPLWYLLPELSGAFPGMTLSSAIKNNAAVLSDIAQGACSLAVLPFAHPSEEFESVPFLKEKLSICVPPEHALAKYASVTFDDLNGHNFLLASHLGFWYDLCIEKMPASRFHVQTSDLAMEELIRSSSLPCFTTDLGRSRRKIPAERIEIPITDPEADVTFCLVFRKDNKAYAEAFRQIASSPLNQ